MDDARNRHARTTNFPGRKPATQPRPGRRLRVALAVAVTALAGFAAVPAAQATTGGAGAFEEPAPAPTATGSESSAPIAAAGSELAFGPARWAGASWYGPGLWGRSTACGQVLRPTTVGVANKTLPCGTTIRFTYHGRSVVAPVIDRGPYVRGRAWDLTAAAAEALEFEGVGVGLVRYQVATSYARTSSR
jgi:rare lipoprotein A (peptidoglycan hydrolase)